MKKLFVVAITLIASFVGHTQDRVNRPKLSFTEESKTISNVTGWKYNTTIGEWVDYQNVISSDKDYKDKYKSLQGRFMMARAQFAFDSIQIKKVVYQEKKYNILIVHRWTGRYKYPNIQQDWITYRIIDAYFIDEDELNNLKSFTKTKLSGKITYDLEFESYSETKFLDLIQTELSRTKSNYESFDEGILITKTKDNQVRFLTPYTLRYFESTKYSSALYDFSKMYFETDPENFSKIFN